MNLVAYQHKKSQMSGIQLTAATQEDIVNLLMPLVATNQLTDFSATYDTKQDCYAFTFRYWTDSSVKTLNPGDYLLIPAEGNMEAWTAASLAETYEVKGEDEPVEPTPGVYADGCILDE